MNLGLYEQLGGLAGGAIGGKVLGTAGHLLGQGLDLVDIPSALLRRGIGNTFGMEATGDNAYLGSVHTGRDLLQGAGFVGADDGEFGWDDVAGMGVDAVLDPVGIATGLAGAKWGAQAGKAAGRRLGTEMAISKAGKAIDALGAGKPARTLSDLGVPLAGEAMDVGAGPTRTQMEKLLYNDYGGPMQLNGTNPQIRLGATSGSGIDLPQVPPPPSSGIGRGYREAMARYHARGGPIPDGPPLTYPEFRQMRDDGFAAGGTSDWFSGDELQAIRNGGSGSIVRPGVDPGFDLADAAALRSAVRDGEVSDPVVRDLMGRMNDEEFVAFMRGSDSAMTGGAPSGGGSSVFDGLEIQDMPPLDGPSLPPHWKASSFANTKDLIKDGSSTISDGTLRPRVAGAQTLDNVRYPFDYPEGVPGGFDPGATAIIDRGGNDLVPPGNSNVFADRDALTKELLKGSDTELLYPDQINLRPAYEQMGATAEDADRLMQAERLRRISGRDTGEFVRPSDKTLMLPGGPGHQRQVAEELAARGGYPEMSTPAYRKERANYHLEDGPVPRSLPPHLQAASDQFGMTLEEARMLSPHEMSSMDIRYPGGIDAAMHGWGRQPSAAGLTPRDLAQEVARGSLTAEEAAALSRPASDVITLGELPADLEERALYGQLGDRFHAGQAPLDALRQIDQGQSPTAAYIPPHIRDQLTQAGPLRGDVYRAWAQLPHDMSSMDINPGDFAWMRGVGGTTEMQGLGPATLFNEVAANNMMPSEAFATLGQTIPASAGPAAANQIGEMNNALYKVLSGTLHGSFTPDEALRIMQVQHALGTPDLTPRQQQELLGFLKSMGVDTLNMPQKLDWGTLDDMQLQDWLAEQGKPPLPQIPRRPPPAGPQPPGT